MACLATSKGESPDICWHNLRVKQEILRTPRLILRTLELEDVPVLYSFFSDQETMRFYPATRSVSETEEFVERQLRRYAIDGFGPWGVCLKSSGDLIGYCGLVKQVVESKDEIEIGYLIGRRYWRKGFASEAAAACRDYGVREYGFGRLISLIDPGNEASMGVARKVGMALEKQCQWQGKFINVFAMKTAKHMYPASD